MTIHQNYFVVMIDYGRRGYEATVDPEITRRGLVERVSSREYKNIVFIHQILGSRVIDITTEVIDEALAGTKYYEDEYPKHVALKKLA